MKRRSLLNNDSAKLGVNIILVLLFLSFMLYIVDLTIVKQSLSIEDSRADDIEQTASDISTTEEEGFWDAIGLGFLDDVAEALTGGVKMLMFAIGEIGRVMFLDLTILDVPILGGVVKYVMLCGYIFAIIDIVAFG